MNRLFSHPDLLQDFIIEDESVHSLPGIIFLRGASLLRYSLLSSEGIESPGLTASLSLAEEVLERLNLVSEL